jgi:hypothetical protein
MSLRIILLVIHIIAAGLWISGAAAEFFLGRMIKANRGKPTELTLMSATVQYLGVAGSLAGITVLLTGLGLTWVDGLGILGIGGSVTPTWLFIKQVIYIILLVIVFAGLQPVAVRLSKQFAQAASGSQTVTPETYAIYDRFRMIATLHNLLVLVNIILAVWKPT